MAHDISSIIKKRIKSYDSKSSKTEEGKVISIADGIATVSGLNETMAGELLIFEGDTYGMALNLEEDYIGVILFGQYSHIEEGSKVKRTKTVAEVPAGDEMLGRVVDATGRAIDGKGDIKTKATMKLERKAPGIMERQSVFEPLETGILAIDSMIPIGKGQRELIIGDRKTGKSAIAIDTIMNQKGKNVKCVYVSIGQKNSTLAVTAQKLEEAGAMEYTTIVSASASESDAMQYVSPYTGVAIAEYWMEQGDDVLIIYDDLSKHAVAYRSVSLLLRRPPGREAYPGDVFYLHSRLLERAAKLSEERGGGSITALPIIETQAGDISAYIPTNVISITDGQIFLVADQFNSGQRPAVDSGLSVSRVGSSAQTKLMKKVSGKLKMQLATYEEMKAFAKFSSDLDDTTKAIIDNGNMIKEFLKQQNNNPYDQSVQAIMLFGIDRKLFKDVPSKQVAEFKKFLLNEIETDSKLKKVKETFDKKPELEDKIAKELETILNSKVQEFLK